MRLAALVFPEFEMLDLFGPLEMLCFDADVTLVAAEAGPVRAKNGPEVLAGPPEAAAGADILLIPGGQGTRPGVTDTRLLEIVDSLAGEAATVATVCTGSALLAATGRLDARPATTNKRAFAWVRSVRPAVDWQPSARWVRSGNVVTSSGVAAGMDMALALLADLKGRARAEEVAARVEYRWNDDAADDPFAVSG